MRQASVQAGNGNLREGPAKERIPLCRKPPMGLAEIATARIQRAAQRTDRCAVGRSRRRCLVPRGIAAEHAGDLAALGIGVEQLGLTLAGDVKRPPVSQAISGAQSRGRAQGDDWRGRLGQLTEEPTVGEDRQQRGDQHRAHTHRVDVVEMRAFEFDLPR